MNVTCEYCKHEAPLEEMREVTRSRASDGGPYLACKDVAACDARDDANERARKQREADAEGDA